MMIQQDIVHSFQSPIVRVLLGAIALALLYVFYKEVRNHKLGSAETQTLPSYVFIEPCYIDPGHGIRGYREQPCCSCRFTGRREGKA